ncbi:MAG: TetR/AcrR family transcriptional regulator [Nitrospirota bacterium]
MPREVRRTQIAEAALRIIARQGVRALTTSAIAQEVGISEANLYRHFRNKDEILSEMVDMIGEGLRKNFESVFKTDATPISKLKKVFRLHLDYIEKNEGIPRLGFSEDMHWGNRELGERLLTNIERYADELEKLIQEGQKTGALKRELEPRTAALMLIGMVQVVTFRWSLSGFSFPLVAEGMKMWENFESCVRFK